MKRFILATGIVLCGCMATMRMNDPLIDRLNGRGPVALSSSNPYLAANLFLRKQLETRPELDQFVRSKGLPGALAVEAKGWEPLRMTFYYPAIQEKYIFEERSGTWQTPANVLLRGDELAKLMNQVKDQHGAPTLLPSTRPADPDADYPFAYHRGDPVTRPLANEMPELGEFRSPAIPAEKRDELLPYRDVPAPTPSRSRWSSSKVTLEELVSRNSDRQAESTPAGDLIHYVTDERETVRLISFWYTGSVDEAQKLARLNELGPDSQLAPGDTVVIPSYLIKNRAVLPAEEIEELLRITPAPQPQLPQGSAAQR